MMGRMGRTACTILAAFALLAPRVAAEADKYDVFAVRFATLANFPVSSLVAGADRSRRLDIAMMIWVLKGADGRVARWSTQDFTASATFSSSPARITFLRRTRSRHSA